MKRDHSTIAGGGDIESSFKRICDIKREEINYDKRIQNIDEQIAKLEHERQKCMSERTELVTSKLDEAIVPYSQAWTLQFVTEMRSRLPRELRDMVYNELAKDHFLLRPWRLADISTGKGCQGQGSRHTSELDLPHVLDPTYVGPEIALEIVEACYKAYPMHFFVVERVEHIKNVLLLDHFHVGFKPANVVREMRINWKLSRSVHEENKKSKITIKTNRRPAKKDFNALLEVRNKSGFCLQLILSQRHIKFIALEKALNIIKPICHKLTEQGATVDVSFLYDTHDGLHWSLNDALTQPPTTWKKNLASFLDDNEDIVLDHHKEYKHETTKDRSIDTSSEDSEMFDEMFEDSMEDFDEDDFFHGIADYSGYGYDGEELDTEALYEMGII